MTSIYSGLKETNSTVYHFYKVYNYVGLIYNVDQTFEQIKNNTLNTCTYK